MVFLLLSRKYILKYYAYELQDSKFQYDPHVSVKTPNEMSQGSLVQ